MVEDIDAAIEFFTELGLELEGRAIGWAIGLSPIGAVIVLGGAVAGTLLAFEAGRSIHHECLQ